MHTDSSMGEAPPNYRRTPVSRDGPVGRRHEHRVERALAAHNHFLDTASSFAGAPATSSSTATIRSTRPPMPPRRISGRYSPGMAGCARDSTRATPSAATRRPAGCSTKPAPRRCAAWTPSSRIPPIGSTSGLERGQIQFLNNCRVSPRPHHRTWTTTIPRGIATSCASGSAPATAATSAADPGAPGPARPRSSPARSRRADWTIFEGGRGPSSLGSRAAN